MNDPDEHTLDEAWGEDDAPDEAELAAARVRCEAARWPEQHRDDCAWCAHVAATLEATRG